MTVTVSNSTFSCASAGHGGISNGVEARLTVINSALHGVPVINREYGCAGWLPAATRNVATAKSGAHAKPATLNADALCVHRGRMR
jgi:hypothetical protein